jgi:CheY-like chemotaxis protein
MFQILIVEDHKLNYELLKIYMSGCDYSLIWATNGMEAVKIIESKKDINLIIMDYMMPVMNGVEATIKIKKINPDIPVLFFSVYNDYDVIDQFMFAGCSEIIPKPVDRRNLNKIVHQYLS